MHENPSVRAVPAERANPDDPELPAASVYADTGLGVARDAALAALLVLTVLAAHLIGWH